MTIHDYLNFVKQRNAHEPEFLQAVDEVIQSVMPVLERNAEYRNLNLFERLSG
jgi:glutamate dehydrogenase (NADP+)